MKFRTSATGDTEDLTDTVLLRRTGWDDWFKFETLYYAEYFDEDGEPHDIGQVKIGEFGLQPAGAAAAAGPGYRIPAVPERFGKLGSRFFSLGQDTTYYEALTEIGADFREEYLRAMKDIAFDTELLERAADEPVTEVSLLRNVPLSTVKDQYARLSVGGARLTPYDFKFIWGRDTDHPLRLDFAVDPNSRPPTNIHVLIGRNGVGKSTHLNSIARTIVNRSRRNKKSSERTESWEQLTNVVSVSFSAFDAFRPIAVSPDRTKGLSYHYVGLKMVGPETTDQVTNLPNKDLTSLSREMTVATKTCLQGARRARLLRALQLLEGDPIFAAIGLRDRIEDDIVEFIEELPEIFRRLSSGHAIVLLTITKMVETVEEKSLVLLDEPEAHLHPPLLSAFIRALSDLLTNRNGMAIIATHSPVVLQEVPKSCVWKLYRSGDIRSAERPQLETFGENVGILTDEVFGLEVSSTGFHKMLTDVALDHEDYASALDVFDGHLGSEAKAILRAIMSTKSMRRDVGR